MKTLSNGLTVFNGTPHDLRFYDGEVVEVVPSDGIINAITEETTTAYNPPVTFVKAKFIGTEDGWEIVHKAMSTGADLIVGSMIASMAYRNYVVTAVTLPGYEREPGNKKLLDPYKFTEF